MVDKQERTLDRRQALECMVWAGAGVIWTVAGGVPSSRLIGEAKADEAGFSFVQISDSHIGFEKPANPDARGTLKEAIGKALPCWETGLHDTGDIAHAATCPAGKPAERVIPAPRRNIFPFPARRHICAMPSQGGYGDKLTSEYVFRTRGRYPAPPPEPFVFGGLRRGRNRFDGGPKG